MLRFKKPSPPFGVQVPLTSLIDVVFLLLIYFLLTTHFIADEGIRVNLPVAGAVVPQVNPEVTIHIDRSGQVYFQEDPVDLPALLNRLRAITSGSNRPVVVVKADRTVIVDKVVAVMDIAKAAGAEKLLLATERSF